MLAIALPVMLQRLHAAHRVVDTAIVGVSRPAYIGAVALGALVFTFVFWAFGFPRMGTTGLTAQALGAGDAEELAAGLGRALLIAAVVGVALIALQWPIRELAFALIAGSERVEALARGYFEIRIWAAPATLANYALLGWFIGLGRTDIGLVLQLVLNLANIALDAWLVLGLGLDVRGVALGTLIAGVPGGGGGLFIAVGYMRRHGAQLRLARLLLADRLRRTLAVNRDIMIRSLALILVFVWFMAEGARHGDVTLAANAVLMQFVSMSAYFLDGLAFAAEALVGRAIGERNRTALAAAVRLTSVWAVVVAVLVSVVYLLAGPWLIDALSTDSATRAAARIYLPWAALAPLAGVWAFQLDGIFIGATRSAEMRNAMLVSLLVFLVAWWLLRPWGNHGLWAALYELPGTHAHAGLLLPRFGTQRLNGAGAAWRRLPRRLGWPGSLRSAIRRIRSRRAAPERRMRNSTDHEARYVDPDHRAVQRRRGHDREAACPVAFVAKVLFAAVLGDVEDHVQYQHLAHGVARRTFEVLELLGQPGACLILADVLGVVCGKVEFVFPVGSERDDDVMSHEGPSWGGIFR